MARKGRTDESREPGGYCALPWSVIDSLAFKTLSYPAVALLIELARQYVRDNNGRLLASSAYLAKRGWRSRDVITRAKSELIDAQLIYQTVQGHRPNKASWYAVTWYTLDRLPGYDAGAVEGFKRGMYHTAPLSTPKPTREALFDKWRDAGASGRKRPKGGEVLIPPHGLETPGTVPPHGLENEPPRPPRGTVRPLSPTVPRPPDGNHLEIPFCTADSVQLASLQATAPATDDDPETDGGQIERVHDHDLDPAMYDPNTGEYFLAPKAPARKQKHAADRWVSTALAQVPITKH
jgi:hypothetical protein